MRARGEKDKMKVARTAVWGLGFIEIVKELGANNVSTERFQRKF